MGSFPEIVALVVVLLVPGHWGTAIEGSLEANLAFSDFVTQKIQIFKDNLEGSVGVDNVEYHSTADPIVNVTYTNITARNMNAFDYSVSTMLEYSRLFINFTTHPRIDGEYVMEGVTNESIIVRGRGPFHFATSGVKWSGNCTFEVSDDGQVTLNPLNIHLESSPPAFGTFEGIDGFETIRLNITDYLDSVASHSIPIVDSLALHATAEYLIIHLNRIFRTVTFDEIIGNSTIPSTTPQPREPDYVIDVLSDLDESGWTVSSTCTYASRIDEFLCDGSPVNIRDPYDGQGFWMSPCVGECTLTYRNMTRLPTAVGVRGYFSDFALTARISVKLWESGSVVREFDLRRDDGTYNEMEFTAYSYDMVTISTNNDGQGGFGILDTLRVFN